MMINLYSISEAFQVNTYTAKALACKINEKAFETFFTGAVSREEKFIILLVQHLAEMLLTITSINHSPA